MTKRKSPGFPLIREGDSERFKAAVKWAQREGFTISRPSPFQLCIGPYSFYPDQATFNLQGHKRSRLRGFPAFKAAILAWRDEERSEWR